MLEYNFKPMLASNTKAHEVRLPAYGSLKLEGIRGIFTPEGLRARSLKAFNNPKLEEKFKELDEYCRENECFIEGEFYRHGMVFSDISSICRRGQHEETHKICFYVFDYYNPKKQHQKFWDRHETARRIIGDLNIEHLYCVRQQLHTTHDVITEEYSAALSAGYEGYVLKAPNEIYKHGRSTHNEQKFLRMKEENTYDGRVIGITERMTNLCQSEENELGYLSKKQDKDMKEGTGMAAVAIVLCEEFDEPIRVTLSRGLTDSDRCEIWINRDQYIGKHLRFVGIPVKGMLPRSPRFDDWRTDLD